MRSIRVSVATLMAAGLAFAPSAVAQAATGSTADPTGDGVSHATNDITSLAVSNSLSTVTVTITTAAPLPALTDPSWKDNGGSRELAALVSPNSSQRSGFYFEVTGDEDGVYPLSGDAQAKSLKENNKPGLIAAKETKVGDVTVTTSGNSITLSVPASLLGTPARVEALAAVGFFNDDPSLDSYDVAIANGENDESLEFVKAQEPGGQYLLGADGGVFTVGDAQFYGSTGNIKLNRPVVGMAKRPNGPGYWFVASDGGVFTYGPGNQFHGSQGARKLNQPVVGMAPTPSGNGYWLVAADGGIFAHGDAQFYGSLGDKPLNKPIIGMVPTSNGQGYYLYASDGGVFAFGNAVFQGSAGAQKLNKPIVGMALNKSGPGYWLVGEDGGVFSYGTAPFHGSAVPDFAAEKLTATSIVSVPNGYHVVASDGQVNTYGTAYSYDDLPDGGVFDLNAPIVDAVQS